MPAFEESGRFRGRARNPYIIIAAAAGEEDAVREMAAAKENGR
jgi:hypothetical protein